MYNIKTVKRINTANCVRASCQTGRHSGVEWYWVVLSCRAVRSEPLLGIFLFCNCMASFFWGMFNAHIL